MINDNVVLLTGVSYESTIASFNPGRKEEFISGLKLKLGSNIKHNSKWSGTYMLLPNLSSDLKQISNRDFQLGGVVLMKYTKTDQFNYKFGLYSNSELFGPIIIPLFGFYYVNAHAKLEAKILLPIAVDLNHGITKRVRVGVNFKGLVRSYNLNTPIGNEANRYLARTINEIYGYVQYKLQNGIHFELSIGKSIGRSYRIYNEKISLAIPSFSIGDNRTQLNKDFSDSWLFKISAFYRLKLASKS
jgi:hypothetical protein